jgi:biopolymer transport protein ExbD
MAAPVSTDDGELTCAINVAPLVDVMLVLLVVFMLTARAAAGSGVPVDLPQAATATSNPATPLVVTVSAGGALSIDGRDVTDDELRAKAAEAHRLSPDARAVIVARAHVEHGHVVHVLDELRRGGIVRTALAAEKKP